MSFSAAIRMYLCGDEQSQEDRMRSHCCVHGCMAVTSKPGDGSSACQSVPISSGVDRPIISANFLMVLSVRSQEGGYTTAGSTDRVLPLGKIYQSVTNRHIISCGMRYDSYFAASLAFLRMPVPLYSSSPSLACAGGYLPGHQHAAKVKPAVFAVQGLYRYFFEPHMHAKNRSIKGDRAHCAQDFFADVFCLLLLT